MEGAACFAEFCKVESFDVPTPFNGWPQRFQRNLRSSRSDALRTTGGSAPQSPGGSVLRRREGASAGRVLSSFLSFSSLLALSTGSLGGTTQSNPCSSSNVPITNRLPV